MDTLHEGPVGVPEDVQEGVCRPLVDVLPLRGVVAVFPGVLRVQGGSRVVTVPAKYASARYEVLIVVKEKSA